MDGLPVSYGGTTASSAGRDVVNAKFDTDDVPDGINAADHAAGLSSSLDNLAASVER
jgi:hypothetical protein